MQSHDFHLALALCRAFLTPPQFLNLNVASVFVSVFLSVCTYLYLYSFLYFSVFVFEPYCWSHAFHCAVKPISYPAPISHSNRRQMSARGSKKVSPSSTHGTLMMGQSTKPPGFIPYCFGGLLHVMVLTIAIMICKNITIIIKTITILTICKQGKCYRGWSQNNNRETSSELRQTWVGHFPSSASPSSSYCVFIRPLPWCDMLKFGGDSL